jgi:hypothetical protein
VTPALRLGEKARIGWYEAHFLEDLRKLLGVEPVKDSEGNVIQEPALSLWANFRQRALDTAMVRSPRNGLEDRNRIAGAIKTSAGSCGDFLD